MQEEEKAPLQRNNKDKLNFSLEIMQNKVKGEASLI